MNKKTKIIIFVSVLVIMLIAIFGLYILIQLIKEDNNTDLGETSFDIAMITYEGKFQAKGVVVRHEKEILTIMPILANEEYRNEEKFYMVDKRKF